MILTRIRYQGFERVERLVPAAVVEGESIPMDIDSARWLLEHKPNDQPDAVPLVGLDDALNDAVEEMAFVDQAEVGAYEQQRFERNLEQIERYVEDQVLVLRRRHSVASVALRAAEDKRDSALGAEARSQAEERIRRVQEEIDELDAETRRLQRRDDTDYERWCEQAHQRRYKPPEITRILDVDFVLG